MTDQIGGYRAKAFEPRNLAYFFLIVLGLSWGYKLLVYFGALRRPTGAADLANVPNVLWSLGPLIAAIVLTALNEGKPGLRALWRRFWNRDLSLKWLAVCVLLIPALWLAGNLLSRLVDGRAYQLFDQPGMFFGALLAGLYSGLTEEFGWRGYVLPRFQAKWSALLSSLVLGLIWATWHTRIFSDVFLNALTGQPVEAGIWEWVVWLLACSVFMTWIFNNTRGSLLAAVLFHAFMNAGAVFFWCCGKSWYWPVLNLAAAAVIVAVFGAKSLVRGAKP